MYKRLKITIYNSFQFGSTWVARCCCAHLQHEYRFCFWEVSHKQDMKLLILMNSDLQSLNRVPPDVVVPICDKGQKFGETASSKNPVVEWLRPLSAVLCGYIRRGRDKSQHFLYFQHIFLWWLQRKEGDCYEGPLSLCRSLVQTRAPQIEISNEILNEI